MRSALQEKTLMLFAHGWCMSCWLDWVYELWQLLRTRDGVTKWLPSGLFSSVESFWCHRHAHKYVHEMQPVLSGKGNSQKAFGWRCCTLWGLLGLKQTFEPECYHTKRDDYSWWHGLFLLLLLFFPEDYSHGPGCHHHVCHCRRDTSHPYPGFCGLLSPVACCSHKGLLLVMSRLPSGLE